jgi:hypothetical protein
LADADQKISHQYTYLGVPRSAAGERREDQRSSPPSSAPLAYDVFARLDPLNKTVTFCYISGNDFDFEPKTKCAEEADLRDAKNQ